MRLNKFLAQVTSLSRRAADSVTEQGLVLVNGQKATVGLTLHEKDVVTYQGKQYIFSANDKPSGTVLLLNKPIGYVCSRDGQGAPTVYELLPQQYQQFKIAGRLDKDSSGLVVLTDDGDLLNKLTHPSFKKIKTYEIKLNRVLSDTDLEKITKVGVRIGDPRPSCFALQPNPTDSTRKKWVAKLEEGRNRQIRRTFEALGYDVVELHRTSLSNYELGNIAPKQYSLAK